MNQKLVAEAQALVKSFKDLEKEAWSDTATDMEMEAAQEDLWNLRNEPVKMFNRLNKVWTEAGNENYEIGVKDELPEYKYPLNETAHFDEDVANFDFDDELFLLIRKIEELAEKVKKL